MVDKWLTRGLTADEVVGNLRAANFDPEGYRQYEAQIREEYDNHKRQTA